MAINLRGQEVTSLRTKMEFWEVAWLPGKHDLASLLALCSGLVPSSPITCVVRCGLRNCSSPSGDFCGSNGCSWNLLLSNVMPVLVLWLMSYFGLTQGFHGSISFRKSMFIHCFQSLVIFHCFLFFSPQNVPFTLGLVGHRLANVQDTGGLVQEPASV